MRCQRCRGPARSPKSTTGPALRADEPLTAARPPNPHRRRPVWANKPPDPDIAEASSAARPHRGDEPRNRGTVHINPSPRSLLLRPTRVRGPRATRDPEPGTLRSFATPSGSPESRPAPRGIGIRSGRGSRNPTHELVAKLLRVRRPSPCGLRQRSDGLAAALSRRRRGSSSAINGSAVREQGLGTADRPPTRVDTRANRPSLEPSVAAAVSTSGAARRRPRRAGAAHSRAPTATPRSERERQRGLRAISSHTPGDSGHCVPGTTETVGWGTHPPKSGWVWEVIHPAPAQTRRARGRSWPRLLHRGRFQWRRRAPRERRRVATNPPRTHREPTANPQPHDSAMHSILDRLVPESVMRYDKETGAGDTGVEGAEATRKIAVVDITPAVDDRDDANRAHRNQRSDSHHHRHTRFQPPPAHTGTIAPLPGAGPGPGPGRARASDYWIQ
jgi:hypothetical protein